MSARTARPPAGVWVPVTPCAVTALLLAMAAPAGAQTNQEVATRRLLLDRAAVARTEGRHAEALDLYTRAGQLQMTPSVRAFIADEAAAVGHFADALGATVQCLADLDREPTVHNHDAILARCQALRADVQTRVGELVVAPPEPVPADLHVTVAGHELVSALYNVPTVVDPGDIDVVATVGTTVRQRVTVHVNAHETATARLEIPVVPTATEPPPVVTPPVVVQPPPVVTPAVVNPSPLNPTHAEGHAGRDTLRTVAWIAGVGSAMGLVGGTVAVLVQRSAAGTFNGPAGTGQYVQGCGGNADCTTLETQANTASALAWAGFVTGTALGALSTVLFLVTPETVDRGSGRTALRCGGGPGTVGVSCTVGF